ncbi:MAG: hypothetical protein LBO65_05440 [Spirochaetaceae bacterium]|jgi:hypothetical protein|nr:hypothetical protein [Spirochaetaceae bacterium]
MRIRTFTTFSKPFLFLGLSLALFLTGCFNPLDYKAPDDGNGLIHVALPGAGSAKMMLAGTYRDGLSYELSFSGPGGQRVAKTASWGETCTVEVSPGLWTVTVKARDASNNEIAIGEALVDVQAGSRNNADIKMTVLFQSDLTGTFNRPVAGETPAAAITSTTQYTGTITWSPGDSTFSTGTVYTATVTLTAKSDYTFFDGVEANTFTYTGVTSVITTAVNSGTATVMVTFPSTVPPVAVSLFDLSAAFEAPVAGAVPDTTGTDTVQYTMGTVAWTKSDGTTFAGDFQPGTAYKAVVTLTAKSGYTFTGVGSNNFTYTNAAVNHPAVTGASLAVTIIFPATAATVTSTSLSSAFTAPATGGIPATSLTGSQYTGAITWSPNDAAFVEGTPYTATVTLTAETGYTFTGVGPNSFTYTNAAVNHPAGSGAALTVTVTYPATGYIPIRTQADLTNIAGNRSAKYILMNNLNIPGSFASICTNAAPFSGTFNGGGYSITIGSISGSAYVGLFGSNSGTIKNLTVTVTTVTGTGGYAGVIAGKNTGTITKCSVNATVNANDRAGGITGSNWGTIEDCQSAGSVTTTGSDDRNAGGIAGENSDNAASDPKILRCFSSAAVTAGSTNAGGIVGFHAKGTVENCYSTGSITANTNAGGIAGAADTYTIITKCYSRSAINTNTTTGNAGGIAGYHDGAVEKCVALNTQINGNSISTYRIAGYINTDAELDNNYGLTGMGGTNLNTTNEKTTTGRNGADVSSGSSAGQYGNQSFWASLGWAFGTSTLNPWTFTGGLPKLYFVP